jgi:vacuolar-type H+-ATPase subunit C/Vma6
MKMEPVREKLRAIDYAYSLGRIHALEKYLLPSQLFREAAGATTAAEAAKMLIEAGRFTSSLEEKFTREELDDFLRAEKDALTQEMKEIMRAHQMWAIFQEEDRPEKVLPLARKWGNEFILSYLKLKIDLLNLKVVLRGAYLALGERQIDQWLFPGGFLSSSQLDELQQRPLSDFSQVLERTPYRSWWISSWEVLKEEDSFLAFERESENLLITKLREAKQCVFGPEPIFAYALARKHELKLFRLVVAGKMQGLPPATIQQRIGLTYFE